MNRLSIMPQVRVGAGFLLCLTFTGTLNGDNSAMRALQDGVYTEPQAKRGSAVYESNCLSCHAATLGGSESGPALVGSDFFAKWKDLSIGDLFDQIYTTMPLDSPGRLSPQQTADVLAFILSKNEQPAGQQELPTDVAALRKMKLVTAK